MQSSIAAPAVVLVIGQASRGGNYPYRGPRTFADLTLDGADLEPPAKPSLTDADLASLGLAA